MACARARPHTHTDFQVLGDKDCADCNLSSQHHWLLRYTVVAAEGDQWLAVFNCAVGQAGSACWALTMGRQDEKEAGMGGGRVERRSR